MTGTENSGTMLVFLLMSLCISTIYLRLYTKMEGVCIHTLKFFCET